MIKKACDSEGYQLVVRGGRPRQHASSYTRTLAPVCNGEDMMATIDRTKNNSDLVEYASLVTDLLQHTSYEDIVCYGIGHFGTCFISGHQLALLLHISSARLAKSVMVYDPVLSPQERTALEQLGCENISQNELCRRRVQVGTLFYMPHCGIAMYNNLLWANWSPQHLSKVALIGNSFRNYMERSLHHQIQARAPFIFKVMEYWQENPLPPYIEPTVFNDLSLHTFPIEKLLLAPSEMWVPQPPPPTHPSDPEMIT